MDMMDSSARLIRVMTLRVGIFSFFLFVLICWSFKDFMASVDYTFVYLFIIALMQLFSNVYTM